MGAQPRDNVRAISAVEYVVWTQAGFKRAIKALRERHDDVSDPNPVEGFPTVYPCVVRFSGGYMGYHYWQANCTPLSKAIDSARSRLELLLELDANHQA